MSNLLHVRQGIRNIPEICYRQGLSKAVICPGSRNAPLILSFTKHPSMDCLSITDERSAGYFALGMAQLNGEPVAVVCTSGTAVLNIAPAVAEAHYQNLPLIVFTADRPKEWIDQADGQTIRQTGIFNNYIKQSFEVPLETAEQDDLWYFNRVISQAIDTATRFPAGPVHINIPLREPLYTPLPENFDISNIIQTEAFKATLPNDAMLHYTQKWVQYARKMIVFGIGRKDIRLNNLANELALRDDCVVIGENISNIAGEDIIYAPEAWVASLSEDEKKQCRPDLIITIGEGVISKRFKQYLRSYPPAEQWHIGTSANYTDTYKSLSVIIQTDPFTFLSTLNNLKINEQGFPTELKEKKRNLTQKHEEYIVKTGWSDFRVIHEVLKEIPGDSVIHLANSSPVRYSQLSASKTDCCYFSNRGTSGIDGCISTALGSAYLAQKQVYVISGDLAFIYDSNALWNKYTHLNLKIVVLNNNGGNIFSLIDSGSEMENARLYFETPHSVNIRLLAHAYGVAYLECTSFASLPETMATLSLTKGTCILEVKTDAKINTRIFKEYYQYIKHA